MYRQSIMFGTITNIWFFCQIVWRTKSLTKWIHRLCTYFHDLYFYVIWFPHKLDKSTKFSASCCFCCRWCANAGNYLSSTTPMLAAQMAAQWCPESRAVFLLLDPLSSVSSERPCSFQLGYWSRGDSTGAIKITQEMFPLIRTQHKLRHLCNRCVWGGQVHGQDLCNRCVLGA